MSQNRSSIEHHPQPHLHPEHPDPIQRSYALKRLKIVFGIAIVLIALEMMGSFVSGSLALLADAFHVAADAAALGVTLLASWLAVKPLSPKRSYGYYRLEVLAAFLNGLLLLALAAFIFTEAYFRYLNPFTIHTSSMLVIAFLGFLINLIMLMILWPTHKHNLNIRGAWLHVLSDSISSVSVILGAWLIHLTHHFWIDAIVSVFVGVLIIVMALRFLWDSIHVLLEGTPRHMNPHEIEKVLKDAFPQIVNIHDFHVWEITTHLFAMTAHVEAQIHTLQDCRNLIDGMNETVKNKYGIGHTTFQVEPTSRQSR